MPTLREMYRRAERAIERDEEVIYDVAADCGQIVGNVKYMRWFRRAVAEELFGADTVAEAIAADNFRPICNPR